MSQPLHASTTLCAGRVSPEITIDLRSASKRYPNASFQLPWRTAKRRDFYIRILVNHARLNFVGHHLYAPVVV